MITTVDLRALAKTRLEDAEALHAAQRYDAAVYICGYCVELTLKARICRTLRWEGFPSSNREFQDYTSFRTHDLDVLLRLSGAMSRVSTAKHMRLWSIVGTWDPSARYRPTGTMTAQEAVEILNAARELMRVL